MQNESEDKTSVERVNHINQLIWQLRSQLTVGGMHFRGGFLVKQSIRNNQKLAKFYLSYRNTFFELVHCQGNVVGIICGSKCFVFRDTGLKIHPDVSNNSMQIGEERLLVKFVECDLVYHRHAKISSPAVIDYAIMQLAIGSFNYTDRAFEQNSWLFHTFLTTIFETAKNGLLHFVLINSLLKGRSIDLGVFEFFGSKCDNGEIPYANYESELPRQLLMLLGMVDQYASHECVAGVFCRLVECDFFPKKCDEVHVDAVYVYRWLVSDDLFKVSMLVLGGFINVILPAIVDRVQAKEDRCTMLQRVASTIIEYSKEFSSDVNPILIAAQLISTMESDMAPEFDWQEVLNPQITALPSGQNNPIVWNHLEPILQFPPILVKSLLQGRRLDAVQKLEFDSTDFTKVRNIQKLALKILLIPDHNRESFISSIKLGDTQLNLLIDCLAIPSRYNQNLPPKVIEQLLAFANQKNGEDGDWSETIDRLSRLKLSSAPIKVISLKQPPDWIQSHIDNSSKRPEGQNVSEHKVQQGQWYDHETVIRLINEDLANGWMVITPSVDGATGVTLVDNLGQLENVLEELKNQPGRYVIPMRINALTNEMGENNNHFVALVVDTTCPDKVSIRYVNPMGYGLGNGLRQIVERHLRGAIIDVFDPSQRPQVVTRNSENNVYPGDINNLLQEKDPETLWLDGDTSNCGPFLVEALRLMIHGRDNELVRMAMSNEEESLRYGEYLRVAQQQSQIRSYSVPDSAQGPDQEQELESEQTSGPTMH